MQNSDTISAAQVSVTQADREAAAANIKRRLVWQHGGEQPWMDAGTASMRMGEQDDHDEVQAFARHRLSATPAPPKSAPGVEGLVKALDRIASLQRHSREDSDENADWMEREAKRALAEYAALSVPTAPAQSDDRVKALKEQARLAGLVNGAHVIIAPSLTTIAPMQGPGIKQEKTLQEALTGIADDYMTSEAHHPGYVLIPTARFEQLRAAAEALNA